MAKTFKFGENGKWATKTGSSLAFNDQNDNFKPMPFSVTRDSIATRVNKQGLIEVVGHDKLRIDYTDSSKGVALLEPARTNLVTYSEDFSNAVWNTWQVTKTELNNLNPKGINGYYEISHTGSSTDNPNTRLANVSLNGSYTLSVFVKTNQSRYISLAIVDYDGDRASVYFDTVNKTFTTIRNVGSSVTNTSYSEFSNEWIRITLSVNLSNAVYNEVGVGIYNPSGNFSPASGEVISIFGAQLEAGSYATSYIPTSGATSQRQSDVANGAGNSEVFNDSEGVLFANIAALANDQTFRQMSINGTSSNTIRILYGTTSNEIRGFVQVYNSTKADISYISSDITKNTKIAFKYKQNDFALWVDGFKQGTDTDGVTFPSGTLNNFDFNDNGTGGNPFYGKTKELAVFKEALTDAELETLTSWVSFTQMATDLEYTLE